MYFLVVGQNVLLHKLRETKFVKGNERCKGKVMVAELGSRNYLSSAWGHSGVSFTLMVALWEGQG